MGQNPNSPSPKGQVTGPGYKRVRRKCTVLSGGWWSMLELSGITQVRVPTWWSISRPLSQPGSSFHSLNSGSVFLGFRSISPVPNENVSFCSLRYHLKTKIRLFQSHRCHPASKTPRSLSWPRRHPKGGMVSDFPPVSQCSFHHGVSDSPPFPDIASTCSSRSPKTSIVFLVSISLIHTKGGFPDAHIYTLVLTTVVLIIKGKFSPW